MLPGIWRHVFAGRKKHTYTVAAMRFVSQDWGKCEKSAADAAQNCSLEMKPWCGVVAVTDVTCISSPELSLSAVSTCSAYLHKPVEVEKKEHVDTGMWTQGCGHFFFA
jgi:hypothetical protein